jgi:hypothetical protein
MLKTLLAVLALVAVYGSLSWLYGTMDFTHMGAR